MQFFKGVVRAAPEGAPTERREEGRHPAAPENKEPPVLSPGMQVEVMTMENHLLFVGRLTLLDGGVLELRRGTGEALPQVLYNSRIKLQGFQHNSEPFVLEGVVGKTSREFWQVRDLSVLQNREGRSFFRQTTDLEARVMPKSHHRTAAQAAEQCKVLDISAGGARVLTRNIYEVGDTFVLEAELLPSERPFTVACRVVRVTVKKEDRFEYGCQFEAIDEKERQRLLRAIFTIQRKTLRSRREEQPD